MSTVELMAPQGGGGDRSSESGDSQALKRSASGSQETGGVGGRRASPSAAAAPDVVAADEGAPFASGGSNGIIALPADAAMAAAPRRIAVEQQQQQQQQPPASASSAASTPVEEAAPSCPSPAAEADRLRPRPAATPPTATPATPATAATMAATAATSAEPDTATSGGVESTSQRTRRRKKRKPEGSPTLQVTQHNRHSDTVRCPSPSSPSQSPQLGARSPCCEADRTTTSSSGPASLEASTENATAVGDSQGSLDRASDSSRSSQPLAPPSLLSCPSESGMSPRPSPEGTRDPLSRSLEKSGESKSSNKLLEKKKKTSSWYNMLNPTYKSRSEDFKRLFKDLPETERLIVDYSCALQRDILVHGRLYVTQNFICFYANIFRWETNVVIRCRDVTSMTKEKTARVIPNAVQVCTDHEKHFFTSFGARDKTYLMLFRIWQNALMEQPMSTQELWQWVHYSYGDELGLTSDDDDYVAPPYLEDEGRRNRHTAVLKAGPQPPSPFEEELPNGEEDEDEEASGPELFASAREAQHSDMPTDLSDSSETAEPPECPSVHEGKQILNLVLPMSVDQLFTLLFTGSRFFHDLLTSRKTYDVTESNWQPCPETSNKLRQLTYTVTLNHAMAKTAQTTETQILHKASQPGQVYAIDCDVQSTGVPYSDAFCVKSHYCLARLSDSRCRLRIYGCVRYKKSVWGLVKAVIEKNTLQGLEGFCNDLESALLREAERLQPAGGGGLKQRRRRLQSTKRGGGNRDRSSSSQAGFGSSFGLARVSEGRRLGTGTAVKLLLVLVSLVLLMNVVLLYRLWTSSAVPPSSAPTVDIWMLEPPPQNVQEWARLMSQREAFHQQRADIWQRALHDLRHMLRTMESSMERLQESLRMTSAANSSMPPTATASSPGDL
ncbi:GRAM domain containing 1B isoform X2 [Amblyomma americanum]